MNPPKLFISYSWENRVIEQKVMEIASELRSNYRIDVILDKWDLKEGNDAIHFMESMVNYPEIKKVAIICDKTYAKKADARKGGVGTETAIITSEIYEKQDQNKFVAVILEKDEAGKPYLPIYYKNRIYIDLCEEDNYSQNFDKLIRWVHDKPALEKPEIGGDISFLDETISTPVTKTDSSFRSCINAIKENKSFAIRAFIDYREKFIENLELFRMKYPDSKDIKKLLENIESIKPYRNEVIKLLIEIAKTEDAEKFVKEVHKFLEGVLQYTEPSEKMTAWNDQDFYNYTFIAYELFLYAIAIFIKYEKFTCADYLCSELYYFPCITYRQYPTCSFACFCDRQAIYYINDEKSYKATEHFSFEISFEDIRQADFVLYMRSHIKNNDGFWYPHTLSSIMTNSEKPFEIFARSISKSYFEKIKSLLLVNNIYDINNFVEKYQMNRSMQIRNYVHAPIRIDILMNLPRLATLK